MTDMPIGAQIDGSIFKTLSAPPPRHTARVQAPNTRPNKAPKKIEKEASVQPSYCSLLLMALDEAHEELDRLDGVEGSSPSPFNETWQRAAQASVSHRAEACLHALSLTEAGTTFEAVQKLLIAFGLLSREADADRDEDLWRHQSRVYLARCFAADAQRFLEGDGPVLDDGSAARHYLSPSQWPSNIEAVGKTITDLDVDSLASHKQLHEHHVWFKGVIRG